MPAGRRLTVFAVEDTTVQLTWAALGPGPVVVQAADRRIELVADGGPGAVVVDGLPADRQLAVVLTGEGVPGGRTELTARTLRPPPGEELFRLATISDLHLGATAFGFRRTIIEKHDPATLHPERCSAAAIAELGTWGARRLVVKGDVTDESEPRNWEIFGRLVEAAAMPVDVLAGNHDCGTKATIDAAAGLASVGLELTRGVRTVDLPGIRLVLVDSTEPGRHHGRVRHLAGDAAVAVGAGRPGVLMAMHHHLQPHTLTEGWPSGIPKRESLDFLDLMGAANPNTLVTGGHTHRHRRWQRGPVTVTQVGSTKDFPGVWAGYAVHEGGVRQVVRRVMRPDCMVWTERTRAAALGLWAVAAPGRLDARCFTLDWT